MSKQQFIGNSLSTCVVSILNGEMSYENVRVIFSGTRITSEDELEQVIANYQRCMWQNLKGADEICRKLFADGKVFQPRLYYEEGPYGGGPCWYETIEEYVKIQHESGHYRWLEHVKIESIEQLQ